MIRSLRALQVYVQVVDSGTLTAAARVLSLSLPVVSREIAGLEEELGVRLLTRTSRRLSLTDEGRTFYQRARRVLNELDEAVREVRPRPDRIQGTVRLVLPTISGPHGLAEELPSLLDAHPGLRVQISLTDQPVDLVGGGWDLHVMAFQPPDSSHIMRRLSPIVAALGATPSYIERAGLPAHPSELVQHECLRFISERAQDTWPLAGPDGETAAWPVDGRLEMDTSGALAMALRQGLGIGVVPIETLRAEVDAGRLVHVLPGYRWSAVPMFALVPQGRIRIPRVRVVLDWAEGFVARRLM